MPPTATPTIRRPSSARLVPARQRRARAGADPHHRGRRQGGRARQPAQPRGRGVPHREDQSAHHHDPFNNTRGRSSTASRVSRASRSASPARSPTRWSVFAGYSYLESKIFDTSDKSILDRHLPNTPRTTITLWTTYEVTTKWTVGGGAIYQSLGLANNTNTAYVPEFWKFDAMIELQGRRANRRCSSTSTISPTSSITRNTSAPTRAGVGPLGVADLSGALVTHRSGSPATGGDAGRRRDDGAHPQCAHAPSRSRAAATVMEQAAWVDGRVTAGHQSAKVKNNLQLPETAPEARELGDMVVQALGRNRAVRVRRAAQAGVPAAVQPLRRRHDLRLACRQRDPRLIPTPARCGSAPTSQLHAVLWPRRRTTTAAS